MKTALIIAGSALIGCITSIADVGWFSNGAISAKGAFVNILSVIVWVLFVNFIDSKTSKERK